MPQPLPLLTAPAPVSPAGILAGSPHQPRQGRHVLRLVVDGIQHCNLRCTYCHPGRVWEELELPAGKLAEVFTAAERHGLCEVVVSGGEITMHSQLAEVLAATEVFEATAVTMITNATLIDQAMAAMIGRANLTRVCVSVDGVDQATHGAARGKNLPSVLAGLERIRGTGLPVTVISVVHRGNYRRIGELSRWLATTGVADQHHLCATTYSGQARRFFPQLRLDLEDFHAIQATVTQLAAELAGRLYVTFNSFWPATGQAPATNPGRTITLQQLVEQVKDALVNVRTNGELRLNAATWGREMVGNQLAGNLHEAPADRLLGTAEALFAAGALGQLPREVEAVHKFQVGPTADQATTNHLLDQTTAAPATLAPMVPIRPMRDHWLLANPLPAGVVAELAALAHRQPRRVRILRQASGVWLVYDKPRSHVTLLTDTEWQQHQHLFPAHSLDPTDAPVAAP